MTAEEVPSHLDHARILLLEAARKMREARQTDDEDVKACAFLGLLRMRQTAEAHGATPAQVRAWTNGLVVVR